MKRRPEAELPSPMDALLGNEDDPSLTLDLSTSPPLEAEPEGRDILPDHIESLAGEGEDEEAPEREITAQPRETPVPY